MLEDKASRSSVTVIDPESWLSSAERFTGEWQGGESGSLLCIIANQMEPGAGAKMHRHPYGETFVIRRGRVMFDLAGEMIEGRAGQIVVVPAGVAHAFWNPGPESLEMIDIHESGAFETEWL
jgi:mannose-6-phosphate isomerase-like protein (cupin superfamily)